MTRDEQLVYCNRCTNRKMDMKQGLLCGLTGSKAAFEEQCADYALDPSTAESELKFADSRPLLVDEVKGRISMEQFERLRVEQRLLPAIFVGLAASVIGAVLWGAITVATQYQIGYMAIAIGAGVGFTVRWAGNGLDVIFGLTGAVLSLFGCVFGNFLSVVGFVANEYNLGYLDTLLQMDYNLLPAIMTESFNVIDLLFYGLAVYWGYKFSFRKITNDDLATVRVGN